MTHPLHARAVANGRGLNILFSTFAGVVAAITLLFSVQAGAVAPQAGSIIGNQASATYVDAGGVSRTATSNRVDTIVDKIYGLTLTADGTKFSAPGAQVTFPHTLTNTGNTADSYTLNAAPGGGVVTLTNIKIYEDLNGDGTPDNFIDLVGTNVNVAYGGSYKMVLVGSVPGTAAGGTAGTMTVTAISTNDGAQTVTNTDTINVSADAVVGVVKSMSATRGQSPSGTYTVTLAYTNTGNNTATDLTISDTLPAGMSYVAGSAVWSVGGAALTDPAAGDPAGITYQAVDGNGDADNNIGTNGNGDIVLTAVIASVASGDSGTVSFQVNIDAGLAPSTLNNKGVFTFDPDGAGLVPVTAPTDTNIVTFIVDPSAGVTATDTGIADAGANSDTSGPDDVALITTAQEGSTVIFKNVITNTGSGTDTFNITIAALGGAEDFPVGTTFVLLKSDGLTPLADSNGDSVPDTGPISAAGSYNIFVKAILPPAASGTTDVNADGYKSTLTATSANTPGVSDPVVNSIGSITASTVDMTNDLSVVGGAVLADGLGAGPEGAAVRTVTISPTNATNGATFLLYVNNTSSLGDSYELKASTDNTFATIALPAGWSVKFYVDTDGLDAGLDGVIDTDVTQSTSTGAIPAGSQKLVWAVVSVPQNFTAGTYDIFYRSRSPSTGSSDVKHDAVTVSQLRGINLTPSNSGQVYPGGSVVYNHTLSNTGNGVEASIALTSVDNKVADGWSSVIYEDTDGSGGLSAGDAVISSVTNLAAGASKTLFVKVFAPAGALEGVVDTTALNGDAGGGFTATVNDTTTVIIGDLALSKLHALDANCDGAADTGYVTTQIATGALPGGCLLYRITASNSGIAGITSVVVDDATPSFTTYQKAAPGAGLCLTGATTSLGALTSEPADGTSGTITATIGNLAAGASAVIDFCVQIDQ